MTAPQTNGHSTLVNTKNSESVPCVIDNKAVDTGKSYELIDPHDGRLLYKVASADVKTARLAVKSAARAFKTWKDVSPFERRAIFLKALALMQDRKDDFMELAQIETTANGLWAGVDFQLAWNIVSETAALATALRGEIAPAEGGQRAYIERVPYGVVFGIAPWNAPLTLGIRAFANAIMAGNSVVLKTSEYSPKIHTWAAQVFVDAGLPEGVLNILHIAPVDAAEVCKAIISDREVRKVNFTGSTFVGSKIAEVCGQNLKPVCLELGGKSPIIVLEDANLEAAVNSAIFGGFTHSGQICMASDALIVHEAVADEFLAILTQALSSRTAKAVADTPTTYRGLFNQRQADKVNSMVTEALAHGASIVSGTQGSDKNLVQPIVLENVNVESKIYKEEIFGPALIVHRFKTVEEAIHLANDNDYGLAAAVYGTDEAKCFAIARQLEAGQVHINGSTVHDAQTIPHGGVKKSGFGRFNGLEGLREFSTTKTITYNVPHGQYPV